MNRLLLVALSILAALVLGSPPAAARDGGVIAVGDSIVQGVGTSSPDTLSWPARIGAQRAGQAGGCVVSAGCFGTSPMIFTFDRDVLAYRPATVIVAYGINDIAAAQYDVETIVEGLANLVYRARQAGARAYVQTLIPVGPRVAFLDAPRRDVNRLIRARFANVIDPEAALVNAQTGMLKWAYDSGDNLHPNSDGYRVMAGVARAALS